VVLCLPDEVSAAASRFRSDKPLYAKVGLTQDGSTVLRVVFDESKGKGQGYDVIYADVESGGRAGSPQKVPGKAQSQGTLFSCEFPPINLNVPYNENGKGVAIPCQVRFTYRRSAYEVPRRTTADNSNRRRAPTPRIVEVRYHHRFDVIATVALRQATNVWEYSFRDIVRPSETLDSASVWRFNGPSKLTAATRPDVNKKGYLGIALKFSAGENPIELKKGGTPAKALMEVRGPGRKVVLRQEVPLDKLVFG
jgi:hypothetical protein